MNRIRAFREIEQISQSELAESLGVSGAMISQIEAGGRRADKLNWSVLGYSPDRLILPNMSEPMHRHRASTRVASLKRARELLRLGGEVFAELIESTPRSPVNMLDRFPAPHGDEDVVSSARDVRRNVLDCDDFGPIRNLTAVVERAGICLIPLPELPGIDGISAWVEHQPVIGVAPAVSGDRFRLTLGHELGHLVMHRMKSPMIEDEANRFSTVLLMSDEEFDAAIPDRPTLKDFLAVKSNWGLSVASLIYRAHHHSDRLDESRYKSLQIQMSQKWAKTTEPGRFDPVYGQLLSRLVEANGGVSNVADDLGVNERHLRSLTSWRHLRAL